MDVRRDRRRDAASSPSAKRRTSGRRSLTICAVDIDVEQHALAEIFREEQAAGQAVVGEAHMARADADDDVAG